MRAVSRWRQKRLPMLTGGKIVWFGVTEAQDNDITAHCNTLQSYLKVITKELKETCPSL